MSEKEAARRCGNIARAKTSTMKDDDSIARAYRALPAVFGIPFGIMFFLGVMLGWN